ncbi:hypothetical protein BDV10DRAFT_133450 [Aspergillus recurvatus]
MTPSGPNSQTVCSNGQTSELEARGIQALSNQPPDSVHQCLTEHALSAGAPPETSATRIRPRFSTSALRLNGPTIGDRITHNPCPIQVSLCSSKNERFSGAYDLRPQARRLGPGVAQEPCHYKRPAKQARPRPWSQRQQLALVLVERRFAKFRVQNSDGTTLFNWPALNDALRSIPPAPEPARTLIDAVSGPIANPTHISGVTPDLIKMVLCSAAMMLFPVFESQHEVLKLIDNMESNVGKSMHAAMSCSRVVWLLGRAWL